LIAWEGQHECEDAVHLLEEEARLVRQGWNALMMPVALYAGLPPAAQLATFETAPRRYRKQILQGKAACHLLIPCSEAMS